MQDHDRHLAHVIGCAPPAVLARKALSPDGTSEMTVGFVMEDYVHHLRHLFDQLRSLLVP